MACTASTDHPLPTEMFTSRWLTSSSSSAPSLVLRLPRFSSSPSPSRFSFLLVSFSRGASENRGRLFPLLASSSLSRSLFLGSWEKLLREDKEVKEDEEEEVDVEEEEEEVEEEEEELCPACCKRRLVLCSCEPSICFARCSFDLNYLKYVFDCGKWKVPVENKAGTLLHRPS